jgi:hypothetical protein
MTTSKQSPPVATAGEDPTGKLRIAARERNFQQRIEKMQIALATKEVRYKKQIASGLKLLAGARKIEHILADNKIKPLSDYSYLREIYDGQLKHITPDDLQREAEAKVTKFLTTGNKVTPLQEKIAKELFKLEARTNELGIEQVRDFLILKNEIKETPADRKRINQREELVEEELAA